MNHQGINNNANAEYPPKFKMHQRFSGRAAKVIIHAQPEEIPLDIIGSFWAKNIASLHVLNQLPRGQKT